MGQWAAIITQCHPHRVCQCRIRWLWARDSRWATMVPDQTWTCNQTKVSEVLVSICKKETSQVQTFFLKVFSCRFPSLNAFVPMFGGLCLLSPMCQWLLFICRHWTVFRFCVRIWEWICFRQLQVWITVYLSQTLHLCLSVTIARVDKIHLYSSVSWVNWKIKAR